EDRNQKAGDRRQKAGDRKRMQGSSLKRYVGLTGTLHCYVVNIINAVTTPNSVTMHLLPEQ
ncbi:MAG: hypothetical protein WAV28_04855, partial [Sedimentisphaerales bacterium]